MERMAKAESSVVRYKAQVLHFRVDRLYKTQLQ
jgi:hypothetical protein